MCCVFDFVKFVKIKSDEGKFDKRGYVFLSEETGEHYTHDKIWKIEGEGSVRDEGMQDLYFNRTASTIFDKYDEDVISELNRQIPTCSASTSTLSPGGESFPLISSQEIPQGRESFPSTTSEENLLQPTASSSGEDGTQENAVSMLQNLDEIMNCDTVQERPASIVQLSVLIKDLVKVSLSTVPSVRF